MLILSTEPNGVNIYKLVTVVISVTSHHYPCASKDVRCEGLVDTGRAGLRPGMGWNAVLLFRGLLLLVLPQRRFR